MDADAPEVWHDGFVDFLDGIPSWILIASSILIGGLLAGRVLFVGYSGGGGRRLGASTEDFE